MSVYEGPNIKRSNLIGEWDIQNIKSYSNNRLSVQGSSLAGISGNQLISTFPVNGGVTLTRMGYGQTIGGYTIKQEDVVYRFDLSRGGCNYSGNTDFIPSGSYVTVSFDYFITEDAYDWGQYNTGLFNLENYGGGALYALVYASNTTKGVWQTVTQTFGPTSSTGTQAMFIYPGICSGVKQATMGQLYYKNPRVVFSSTLPTNFDSNANSLIWYDTSGNGYHGTKTNSITYGGAPVSVSNQYFDFSKNTPVGNNAYMGNGFTLPSMVVPQTGSFSITGYWKRDSAIKALGDRETIFSNAGGMDGWRFGPQGNSGITYLLGYADSTGLITYGGDEGALGTINTSDGQWHAVTIVYDRNAILGSYKIYGYVDGVLSGTANITNGETFRSYQIRNNVPGIGYLGCCSPFAGYLSYLSVYDTALTASEVLSLHSTLKGRFSV